MSPFIEPLESRIAPAVIFAITNDNKLISFDSAKPDTLLSGPTVITGLVTPATETITDISFRPATGQLYGLGVNNFDAGNDEIALYIINPTTAVATPITVNNSQALIGNDFADGLQYGIDFNPVADKLRIVSDGDRSLRVDPDTGFPVAEDTALDDANAEEQVFAVAYNHSFVGTNTTTLFGIDFAGNRLVKIGGVDGSPSPNTGIVTPIGDLGNIALGSKFGGFDIEAKTGKAFAALSTTGVSNFYSINLSTGAATSVGAVGNGTLQLSGIAVQPHDLVIAATGKTATYTDTDGDKVTVKLSAGTLSADQFTFAAGKRGAQLLQFKFTQNDAGKAAFVGSSLSFTAAPFGGRGDGFVNVGHIDATGIDLGKVVVDGDLGQIDAGDSIGNDNGLASLTVQSMGVLGTSTQLPGGDLISDIHGIPVLTIKGDVIGAQFFTAIAGRVAIGGDLVGGNSTSLSAGIVASSIGKLTLGGSLIGGTTDFDGFIQADTNIAKVTIGGSVIGGAGAASGSIAVINDGGMLGPVSIKGDVIGGLGGGSAEIFAQGSIASIAIGGSVIGGAVTDPGTSQTGFILTFGGIPGGVKIGGDLHGGPGEDGGGIFAANTIGDVSIGGSMIGAGGLNSGNIRTNGDFGLVKVGRDIRGGTGLNAGNIRAAGSIKGITIGGSILGAEGGADLNILAGPSLGPVKVGGSILSKTFLGVFIHARGVSDTSSGIKSVTVKGSVTNAFIGAGAFSNASADATIGAVKVGGNWIASSIDAGTTYAGSGNLGLDSVKVVETADELLSSIASITIGGYVSGTPGGTDQFAFIAEKIGKVMVRGIKVPLTSGLDKIGFELGTTNDFRVREVDGTPAVLPPE